MLPVSLLPKWHTIPYSALLVDRTTSSAQKYCTTKGIGCHLGGNHSQSSLCTSPLRLLSLDPASRSRGARCPTFLTGRGIDITDFLSLPPCPHVYSACSQILLSTYITQVSGSLSNQGSSTLVHVPTNQDCSPRLLFSHVF